MKKSDLSRKYEELKVESKEYREKLNNLKNSRIFNFIDILPIKLKNYLLSSKVKLDEPKEILDIKEEIIEVSKGKVCIVINAYVYKEKLSRIISIIMKQYYINYDIIICGVKSDIEKYTKLDTRIKLFNIDNTSNNFFKLKEVYKIIDAQYILYLSNYQDFTNNFIYKNIRTINRGYDINIYCDKDSANNFTLFIEKSKIKSFINWINSKHEMNILKLQQYNNVKVKWG